MSKHWRTARKAEGAPARSVPPQHPHRHALHLHPVGCVALNGERGVLRDEQDLAGALFDSFEGGFLVVDQGDDSLAIARFGPGFDQDHVAVEDAGVAHRIPLDPERIAAKAAGHPRRHLDRILPQYGLDRPPGGNRSQQGHTTIVVRGLADQTHAALLAEHRLDQVGLHQSHHLLVQRTAGSKTKIAADLGERWRQQALDTAPAEVLQKLVLTTSQRGDGLRRGGGWSTNVRNARQWC